jgi:hypothetical protein
VGQPLGSVAGGCRPGQKPILGAPDDPHGTEDALNVHAPGQATPGVDQRARLARGPGA